MNTKGVSEDWLRPSAVSNLTCSVRDCWKTSAAALAKATLASGEILERRKAI